MKKYKVYMASGDSVFTTIVECEGYAVYNTNVCFMVNDKTILLVGFNRLMAIELQD